MTVTEQAPIRLDPEEARRLRNAQLERVGRWVLPIAIFLLAIWAWDKICVWNEIPRYILPRPWEVLATLWTDAGLLFSSLLVTLRITFLSLLLAVVGGVGLAVLFTQSKWVEMSLFPVRHRLAGDADRGDLPADQYLCGQPDRQASAVFVDRRLLPDPLQHDAGAELGGPQSDRSVPAERRHRAGSSCGICGCPPRCRISSAA